MGETSELPDLEPSVVVAGGAVVRGALTDLLESWGWRVLDTADDELSGVAASRRTRPDLLVVIGSGGPADDPGFVCHEIGGSCRVLHLLDVPQRLTRDPGAVLSGLPGEVLRERLLAALSVDTWPP